MKFKETKIVVILAVVFVLLGSVYAADLTVPHTFSPGATAKSSEMNENLATIYWDADSAINSNPNIGLDSNENALPVPPMLHEIMMQHDLTSQSPLNMMINNDPFSNPNNREILGLPVNASSYAETTGATISGTLFETDGVTPLTGNSYVYAYTGSTCIGRIQAGYSAHVNSETGIYTIPGLPAGTYYLWTSSSNYISEWWASPLSVRDCAGSQSIVVTEGETVTGKNFQLEPGATISGTVYQTDGVTPLTGKSIIFIEASTGSPCGSRKMVSFGFVDSATGIYTISALPAGTYYLLAESSANYISEWWASPLSVRDCARAQAIVVTGGQTVTGKNFQLEPGATISGTVYQSDGVTPLTGKNVWVQALTGSPCGGFTYVGDAYVNSATGIYTILGLPAGTYYLQTQSSNYIRAWWASPLSVRDCAGAQSIVVTGGQTVTGKNFQLEPGATISGTVYQTDGITPLTGKSIYVDVYVGSPCGSRTQVGYAYVNSATGIYTIPALPAGTYYLLTRDMDYFSEWWASPQSVRDCTGAQSIVVTGGQTVSNKNFQLELDAPISGTVYQTDGVTPLTGKSIWVSALTGSPCVGSHQSFQYNINPATGAYTTKGLPAGTYYLLTGSSDNYIGEWWASPLSVRDCAGAQSIVVTEGQTVTGKNFQLEPGATISGTVYQSDGVTPLTGKSININAYTYAGSPCGSFASSVAFAYVNSATGIYTFTGLLPETYFLRTNARENYISEWWASPLSVHDCAGAQSIVVTEGQTVTDKNFQLEPGATISGTIFETDGVTPLTGKTIQINALAGSPCGSGTSVANATVNSENGIYTIHSLPAGTYYLQAIPLNDIREWWASPLSVRDCTGAQSIVVTEGQIVTGKNFQLDTGALFETDGVFGIWKWDGSAWSQLTSTNPENMVTSGSTLYAAFGTSGIWEWNGTAWSQLTSTNPENIVASNSTLYAAFGASGIWRWNGTAWSQLSSANPEKMVTSGFIGSMLYVDFGALGIYKWNGTAWSQLSSTNPENIVASNSTLYAAFGASGIWKWDEYGTSWTQLSSTNPENMVTSSSTLYVDFGALGIYKWNGTAWSQLSSTNPENIVASNSTLYVDFGASYGLYKWDGASWTQLSSTKPENMVTTGSTLYVDFGTFGIYKRNGSSWTQLTGSNPVLMVVLN